MSQSFVPVFDEADAFDAFASPRANSRRLVFLILLVVRRSAGYELRARAVFKAFSDAAVAPSLRRAAKLMAAPEPADLEPAVAHGGAS
jgi:hypothetical protein